MHVEEAIRLTRCDDEAHVRLGLILSDGAVELLLHRECENQLGWMTPRTKTALDQLERHRARVGELPAVLEEQYRDLEDACSPTASGNVLSAKLTRRSTFSLPAILCRTTRSRSQETACIPQRHSASGLLARPRHLRRPRVRLPCMQVDARLPPRVVALTGITENLGSTWIRALCRMPICSITTRNSC